MTEDERKAIEALLAAGVQGKWSVEKDDGIWVWSDAAHGRHTLAQFEFDAGEYAEVACAAVNALPALLADSRRADEAEDWCARLAQDSDAYQKGRQDMLDAVCRVIDHRVDTRLRHLCDANTPHARSCHGEALDVRQVIRRICGSPDDSLPPHERTRRRLARLEAALRQIAEDDTYSQAVAAEALKEDA